MMMMMMIMTKNGLLPRIIHACTQIGIRGVSFLLFW